MGFPKPVDARLTAPLTLPAESGKSLTTQGGNTLDDGTGIIVVQNMLKSASWNIANDGFITVLGVQSSEYKGQGNIPAPFHFGLILDKASTFNSGTGAPTIAGTAGDFFFRTDTPTTADQRIYICTVTGAAGAATWVGIV